jgi:hypothetical protein
MSVDLSIASVLLTHIAIVGLRHLVGQSLPPSSGPERTLTGGLVSRGHMQIY